MATMLLKAMVFHTLDSMRIMHDSAAHAITCAPCFGARRKKFLKHADRCIYANAHVGAYAPVRASMRVCVHQCARVCGYVHVHASVHLRVHVDAYVCVYVCT